MIRIRNYDIIFIEIGEYTINGNTSITFICNDNGIPNPYANITTNFNNILPKNMVYLDTNNCSWVEEIMERYKFGKPIGKSYKSGFCEYPIYQLDLDKIKAYNDMCKIINGGVK